MKLRKVKGVISIPSLVILGLTVAILVFEATDQDGEQSFITIYDGEAKTTMRSGATTVRSLLERAGIKYTEYDTIEPSLDEEIDSETFNINIYRAREAVVIDNNIKKFIHTSSAEPEAVVADAGIQLLDADIVEVVPYDGLLESGLTAAYQITRAKTVNLDYWRIPRRTRYKD